MHGYRIWHPTDLHWLDQAAGAAAWESLSPAEQAEALPAEIVQRGQLRLRETLSSPWGTAILAQSNTEPAGFALLAVTADATTDEPGGVLMDLWVAPQHRRRGLGTGLQSQAEGLFTRLGLRKLKLITGMHSLPALQFSARHGYRAEGVLATKDL